MITKTLTIRPLTVNQSKRNKGWFKDSGKKAKANCLICGTSFEYYPSNRLEKYCSLKCYHVSCRGKKRPEHSLFMKKHFKENNVKLSFLGKTHSAKERENISKRMKKKWGDKDGKYNSQEYRQKLSDNFMNMGKLGVLNTGYSRGNSGWYDNGIKRYFMRSSWEKNYARYLDFLVKQRLIKDWQYEVDTFWFEKIRRGVRSYKPDFKIFNNNDSIEYHEVKGWMDKKSKTKIKRMAKYYPKTRLIIIDEVCYKEIKKKVGKMLYFS